MLPFVKVRKNSVNTTDLLPDISFFSLLDEQFVNAVMKNKLTNIQYEAEKNFYLSTADPKLLLFALKHKNDNVIIVSEETERNNDNKLFKKLPSICKILELDIITLPQYLQLLENFEIDFQIS